jgi:hypothetical protein
MGWVCSGGSYLAPGALGSGSVAGDPDRHRGPGAGDRGPGLAPRQWSSVEAMCARLLGFFIRQA